MLAVNPAATHAVQFTRLLDLLLFALPASSRKLVGLFLARVPFIAAHTIRVVSQQFGHPLQIRDSINRWRCFIIRGKDLCGILFNAFE